MEPGASHLSVRGVLVVFLGAVASACIFLLVSLLASGPQDKGGAKEVVRPTHAPSLQGALKRHRTPSERGGAGPGRIEGVVSCLGQPVFARVDLLRAGDRRLARAMAGDWRTGPLDVIARATHVLAPPILKEAVAETPAPEGHFAFAAVPIGFYVLRAQALDGATGFATLEVIPGAPSAVEIAIPGGLHVLRGHAVHTDARPFAGIVSVRPSGADDALHDFKGEVAVRTASDGSFALAGLLPGRYEICATAPGRSRVTSLPVSIPYDGSYVFRVDAGLVERRGRVLAAADGAPVPGAQVVVLGGEPAWRGQLLASARTDASGGFRLWIADSWRTLSIEADGFAPKQQVFDTGDDGEMTVRLFRHGHLAGRVTEAGTGRPVPEVQVYARTPGGGAYTATSDEAGAYRLDVAPGTTTVVVVSEAWVMSGPRPLLAHQNAWRYRVYPSETTTADLVVEPAAHVGGIVLDADGNPAAGARIYVNGPRAPGAPAPARLSPWLTGSDGRFQIGGLLSGLAYTLEFRHPSAPYFRKSFTAGRDTDVVVRLPAPRRLVVRITDDATGEPIPGARVRILRGNPTEAYLLEETGTHADGVARTNGLPPGPLTTTAQAEGYVASPFALVPGSPTEAPALEQRIALTRGLTIEGRVLLPDGAEWEALEVDGWSEDMQADVVPAVRPDGSFRFDGLAEGATVEIDAFLDVGADSYWGSLQARAGDRDMLLPLAPSENSDAPTLRVVVRNADGEESGWGMVGLYAGVPPMPRDQQRYMNGRARLRLPAALGDAVWLAIQPWEHDPDPGGAGPTVTGPISPRAGEVEVRLPPGSMIEGRVTDEQGKAVAGWTVEAVPDVLPPVAAAAGMTEASGLHGFRVSATTRADGSFRIGGLVPRHRYRVGVRGIRSDLPAGFVREPPRLIQTPYRDLVIVVRKARPRTLRVEAPDGRPVEGAWVTWNEGPGVRKAAARVQTDAAGRATALHLDPDVEYFVRVYPPTTGWNIIEVGDDETTVRFTER